jgi:putative CocE/NonD family hydrolase
MGDDAYHNGAFMLAANFGFYTFFKPRTEIAPPAHEPRFDYGTTDGYDFYLHMGPLSNAKKIYLKDTNRYWDEQVVHPNYDQYWKSRNISAHMKNVRCAVLTVGGWFDAEDLVGPRKIFHSIAQFNPATSNKLVLGPWVHGGWASTEGDHLGDVNFAANNSDFYNEKILLPFFREHLKDAGDAKLPTAYAFETGTNIWRRYDTWPPKDTEPRTLYLRADGRLLPEAPTETTNTFDEYVSDPNHPVPFVNFPTTDVPQTYMDADQRFAAKRPDVLVYQTDPLENDMTISGPVSPHLWVSTSGTDSDFVVKLIDVYPMDFRNPDPNPREVEMGGYQQLVRGEPFRGKFRNSFEKPEPFTPNQPTALNFSLPDINHSFRRGHRIMIQIQSTWFPLVDRDPQKFINIPDATESDFVKAAERVYRSKENPTSIVLPLLQ